MIDILKQVIEIADKQYGIVRTCDIENLGIKRVHLKKYVDMGFLVRESKGIYHVEGIHSDEYSLLQTRCPKGIFSFKTALFFHGLTTVIPHIPEMTVAQGYNANRIKQSMDVKFHYVKKELLHIGEMEMISPQGGKIKIYDKERCICDLIKYHDSVDEQVFIESMKEYFRNRQIDLKTLLKYAKELKIEKKLFTYTEVLL